MRIKSVLIPAALVALVVGWYLFRPELLFIDNEVEESLPQHAAEGTALLSGEFFGVAHETRGTATIYSLKDGTHLLRLTDFETSNGPDVHVYLSSVTEPRDNESVENSNIVALGSMKGNVGDQNYELPADLDLETVGSVVIWCKRFGVNFGAAPLDTPVY